MERTTLEIIAVCKGNTRYDSEVGLVDAVKNYMSDTCMCEKKDYTYDAMKEILTDAFFDFIDNCDRPSFHLRRLTQVWGATILLDEICSIFRAIQIRQQVVLEDASTYVYVNGFNPDFEMIVNTLK